MKRFDLSPAKPAEQGREYGFEIMKEWPDVLEL